jgi:polar amino acid transport system permease protein
MRALFLDEPRAPATWVVKAVTFMVVLGLLAAICLAALLAGTRQWEAVLSYRDAFWNGWVMTVQLSVCALVGSLAFGTAAALAKGSRILVTRYVATIYIDFVRGTPFLVLILLLYFGFPQITQQASKFGIGVLALSLFAGAYIAEIIRAGLDGVGASQRESARAIGLTRWQMYRFVISPQAVRQILPPLTGQFASLIKDSSLLFVIGLPEITYAAQQINSATYSTLESFLPLALAYLALTLPMTFLSSLLEKHYRYET